MRFLVVALIAFVVAIGLVRPAGAFGPGGFGQHQNLNLS
jgi:hypothetical protein